MYRSFTDRVFGGVCGGLAPGLRLNAWLLRTIFVAFTLASLGIGFILYLSLWWLAPQESLIAPHDRSPLRNLLALLVVICIVGAWVADLSGTLPTDTSQSLLWPLVLTVLSVIFFIHQLRRT